MIKSGETAAEVDRLLKPIVAAHRPHEKSLSYEESKEAYNEEAAREAFGDEFINGLKARQADFRGDWWHLALLIRNLKRDKKNSVLKDRYRIRQWNRWRERVMESTGSRSEELHLEGAHLADTHLEQVKLMFAHLENADLAGAHLEHANLICAQLEHANVEWAHLEHASLRGATLEHANMEWAYLEHVALSEANLEHANVEFAHLEHADLSEANLEHARLREAGLDRADVRRAEGLRFDRNRVEGISIEANAPDPWSVLRRKYTGPWFFVHLLLLGVFFAPYAAHALYLTTKSQYQEWFVEEYKGMEARLPDVEVLRSYHEELEAGFARNWSGGPRGGCCWGCTRGGCPSRWRWWSLRIT